jgi:hypothetical protein
MPFKPGDRVRYPTGKTGTVLSTPRQYDRARGDPFTGLGVEVRIDPTYGSGVVVEQTQLLSPLDGPEVVIVVDLADEEVLLEIVRTDLTRGMEPVESAARRLQKQIISAVERAAQLDSTFRDLGTRVTISQAMEVLEAHGELVGLVPLRKVRDVEVNILVVPQS